MVRYLRRKHWFCDMVHRFIVLECRWWFWKSLEIRFRDSLVMRFRRVWVNHFRRVAVRLFVAVDFFVGYVGYEPGVFGDVVGNFLTYSVREVDEI